MSQVEGGDQCDDLNNVNVHSDIDRCIATLLKNPPSRSTPLKFKSSEDTTFEVELRTWKPKEDFINRMKSQDIKIYPYSFKVIGNTKLPLVIEKDDNILVVNDIEPSKPQSEPVENSPSRKRTHSSVEKPKFEPPQNASTPKVDLDKRISESPQSSEKVPTKKPKLDEQEKRKDDTTSITDDDMIPASNNEHDNSLMDTAEAENAEEPNNERGNNRSCSIM